MFLLLLAHFVHCEMRGKVTELLARKQSSGAIPSRCRELWSVLFLCQNCCCLEECVEEWHDTDEDDADYTYQKGDALGERALEWRNNAIVLVNKHCLHHEEVVVERHDGVNQCDEHKDIHRNRAGLQCRGEDKEFAKESCKRRDTCQ